MTTEARCVLVVDDDTELLAMVQALLEDAGYCVVTAQEGREALQRVAQEMPAVILLDLRMPGMNGWEFAREYRAAHDHCAPLIVFTAGDDPRPRVQEIGAAGYLNKPFEFDDLIRIVQKHARC